MDFLTLEDRTDRLVVPKCRYGINRSTLHNIAVDRRPALEFAVFCRTAKTLFLGLFNPLNAELNSICRLLTLLGAHHILHISRIRVKRDSQAVRFSGHLQCCGEVRDRFSSIELKRGGFCIITKQSAKWPVTAADTSKR